jgi:hypothetical protein
MSATPKLSSLTGLSPACIPYPQGVGTFGPLEVPFAGTRGG